MVIHEQAKNQLHIALYQVSGNMYNELQARKHINKKIAQNNTLGYHSYHKQNRSVHLKDKGIDCILCQAILFFISKWKNIFIFNL